MKARMETFKKPRPLDSSQESTRHLRAQQKTCPAFDAFSIEKGLRMSGRFFISLKNDGYLSARG